MSVTFDWYNEEKTIVKFSFVDPWKTHEMAECEKRIRSEMMHFNHVVDAIMDVTQASVLPKDALSYFTSSLRKGKSIENEGVTAIYGANMLVKAIANSIQKIARTEDIYFVHSLEEGVALLETIQSNRKPH